MRHCGTLRSWGAPRLGALIFVLCAVFGAERFAYADLLPKLFGDDAVVVWEGGDQFIKLVPQDKLPDGSAPPANEHPAGLASKDIETGLAALTLWRKGSLLTSEESAALFTPGEAQLLGRKLAEALGKAAPGQDVIFAVVGAYDNALFGKNKLSIAGRVFVTGGRLNIILGDVLRETRDAASAVEGAFGDTDNSIDRRRFPHEPGRRERERSLDASVVAVRGVDYSTVGGAQRGDWLVLDLPTIVAEVTRKAAPQGTPLEASSAAAKAEAEKLSLERRQMREEMARMRKELREKSAGSSDSRTVEERLATLDQLHQKNLISDDEYQRKRSEILEGI